jgi:hypothetical protein
MRPRVVLIDPQRRGTAAMPVGKIRAAGEFGRYDGYQ